MWIRDSVVTTEFEKRRNVSNKCCLIKKCRPIQTDHKYCSLYVYLVKPSACISVFYCRKIRTTKNIQTCFLSWKHNIEISTRQKTSELAIWAKSKIRTTKTSKLFIELEAKFGHFGESSQLVSDQPGKNLISCPRDEVFQHNWGVIEAPSL